MGLRVAVLCIHASPYARAGSGDGGGMSVYVRQLSAHLARIGAEVRIFTRASSSEEVGTHYIEPGLSVVGVKVGGFGKISRLSLYERLDEFAAGVEEAIQKEDWIPQVLHAHYWLSGLVAHAMKHELGIPMVVSFHTLASMRREAGLVVSPPFREQVEEEIAACADTVFYSSAQEREALVATGRVAGSLAEASPGVDAATFLPGPKEAARRALGISPDSTVVLYAGRLERIKRVELLVEQFQRLKRVLEGVSLIILGGPSGEDGESYVRELRRKAEGAPVFFKEPVGHEELSSYYRAADVVVLPSASETYGMVVLEAAACGTPSIVSRGSGVEEFVVQNGCGRVFDSPDRLGAELESVLSSSAARAQMGTRGARAASLKTWRQAARQVLKAYEGVLESEIVRCS